MKQRQRNGGLSANPDLGEMCPGPPPADQSRLVLALLDQLDTPDSSSVLDFVLYVWCIHTEPQVCVCVRVKFEAEISLDLPRVLYTMFSGKG